MDKQIKKKTFTPQRIFMAIAGLAFLAFSVYSITVAGNHSSLNVNKDKITISEVSKGVFDEFIVVTGVVQPLKTYQLDAIEGGYVVQKWRPNPPPRKSTPRHGICQSGDGHVRID
jgi:HlyD family secretion protein